MKVLTYNNLKRLLNSLLLYIEKEISQRVPSKTSQLINNSGYINRYEINSVLESYWNKNEPIPIMTDDVSQEMITVGDNIEAPHDDNLEELKGDYEVIE